MFVGLVKDPGRDWRPPDDQPDGDRRRSWQVPWRLVARVTIWAALLGALFALVPVADHVLGHLAAYVLILLAVSLGVWRVDRWFSRQYWEGLSEHQP
jgi:hypothetical protein